LTGVSPDWEPNPVVSLYLKRLAQPLLVFSSKSPGELAMNRWMYIFMPMLCSGYCFAVDQIAVGSDELIAFVIIDSDRNGYVSRVEARSIAAVESRFESADTNRDGLLDEKEYLGLGHAPSPR
jgi:hypothetical protein